MESESEELCGEERQVIINFEEFGLCVEVVLGRHFVATRYDPQGLVLDGLELADVGGGGVWVPYRRRVVDDGFNDGPICVSEVLLAVAPVRAG